MKSKRTLIWMKGLFGVCKLPPGDPLPAWISSDSDFYSVTRTVEELSIVCLQDRVPAGITCEMDWRVFRLEGNLDFSLTGILFSVLKPLQEQSIPVFTISTYSTDYILVKKQDCTRAERSLREFFTIQRE